MERSKNIYERIKGYPMPPMIPLPDLKKIDLFEELELPRRTSTQHALGLLAYISGFSRFIRKSPQEIEALLRTTNLRGAALFAFVVSATLTLANDERKLSPFERAATLILAAYQFYFELMSGKLEPDKHGDDVLEMGQYPNLFSTGLVVEGKPQLYKSKNITQITLVVNQQMFVIQLGDAQKIDARKLANSLAETASLAEKQEHVQSIGLLSAVSNAVQIRAFNRIRKKSENKRALELLKHSFITICLDLEHQPETDAEAARLAHTDNPENRWYHQSLQLVVFGNSKAAAICHFSAYLDGNTMMRGAAEIQSRAALIEIQTDAVSTRVYLATPVKWQIPERALHYAQRDFNLVKSSQPATFVIDKIGASDLLIAGSTPVQTFIVALALAVKETTGHPARITQFLTMSKFRCLDLTTAAVSTSKVNDCVDHLQNEADDKKAFELLKEAASSQAAACRRRRGSFPLTDFYALYRNSQKAPKKWIVNIVSLIILGYMRRKGVFLQVRRQVVVSHPAVYPEVSIVGRPGVRLPYVGMFGLHYQIWPDKIVLTFMPGIKWAFSNENMTHQLKQNLARLSSIIATYGDVTGSVTNTSSLT